MVKEFNEIICEFKINDFPFAFSDILVPKYCGTIGMKEDYAILGNSRIGGYPDLPKSWSYPIYKNNTYPRFIAQLNLNGFYCNSDSLPNRGILYLFEGNTDDNETVVLYTSSIVDLETKKFRMK